MKASKVQAPWRIAPVMARRRGEKDVWQIALVRMPAWIEESDGERYRPWGAIAASLATGMIAPSTVARNDERQGQQALEAFEALAATTGDLPGRVQVANAAMAEALAGGVAVRGVAVEVWDRLAAIDAARAAIADVAAGPSSRRSPSPEFATSS